MKNRIITISREFGSGGRTIGKKVAENYIKDAGEYTPGGFLASAFANRSMGPTNEDYLWNLFQETV